MLQTVIARGVQRRERVLWAAAGKVFLKERGSELGLEGQEDFQRLGGRAEAPSMGTSSPPSPGTWGSAILCLRKDPQALYTTSQVLPQSTSNPSSATDELRDLGLHLSALRAFIHKLGDRISLSQSH